MRILYLHYVYFGRLPHEIMSLSPGERTIVDAFLLYALSEGDIDVKIRNFSTKKNKA